MERTDLPRFSVCPHDTAQGIERWASFLAIASRATGCSSRFVPYFNFKELDAALAEERIAWGYLNPAQFLAARRRAGYLPLARPEGRRDKALLLRPSRSDVRRLDDVRGKRLAAVPGFLFALARHALAARGIEFLHVPARGYGDVVGMLAGGQADVGVTYNEHHDELGDPMRSELVAFETIDSGLTHVMCAHPALPEPTRQAIAHFLLGAAGDEVGRSALRVVGIDGFQPVDLAPFEALEKILVPPGAAAEV